MAKKFEQVALLRDRIVSRAFPCELSLDPLASPELYGGLNLRSEWRGEELRLLLAKSAVRINAKTDLFLDEENGTLSVSPLPETALRSEFFPNLDARIAALAFSEGDDGRISLLLSIAPRVKPGVESEDDPPLWATPSVFCAAYPEYALTSFALLDMACEYLAYNGGGARVLPFSRLAGAAWPPEGASADIEDLPVRLEAGVNYAPYLQNFTGSPLHRFFRSAEIADGKGAPGPRTAFPMAGSLSLDGRRPDLPGIDLFSPSLSGNKAVFGDILEIESPRMHFTIRAPEKDGDSTVYFGAELKSFINKKEVDFSAETNLMFSPLEHDEECLSLDMNVADDKVLTTQDIMTLTGGRLWTDSLPGPVRSLLSGFGIRGLGAVLGMSSRQSYLARFAGSDALRLGSVRLESLGVDIQSNRELSDPFLAPLGISAALGLNWRLDRSSDSDSSSVSLYLDVVFKEKKGGAGWARSYLAVGGSLRCVGLLDILDKEGMSIPEIAGKFFPALGGALAWIDDIIDIRVKNIRVDVDPAERRFEFSTSADIKRTLLGLSVERAEFAVAVRDAGGKLQATGGFSGTLLIASLVCRVEFEKKTDHWFFKAAMPASSPCDILKLASDLLGIDLALDIFKITVSGAHFTCRVASPPGAGGDISPTGDNDLLELGGTVALEWSLLPLKGSVSATLEMKRSKREKSIDVLARADLEIRGLPRFSVVLHVYSASSSSGGSKLLVDASWEGIRAGYSLARSAKNDVHTFSLAFGDEWNLGKLLKKLLWLVGIGRDAGELPAPWSLLNAIPLGNFYLKIAITRPSRTPEVMAALDADDAGEALDLLARAEEEGTGYTIEAGVAKFDWKLFFVDIDGIAITAESGKKQLAVKVSGSCPALGKDSLEFAMSDDPALKRDPAAIPGGAFSLPLLFVGQHIGNIVAPGKKSDIASVLAEIRVNLKKNDSFAPAYDKNRGWLFGMDFSLHDGLVGIGLLFLDPDLYGLRVSSANALMKGFSFDVLYQKLSDSLGVFRANIVLPEFIRTLYAGPFIITLPSFGIEVFTNGNFSLDVGFPRNADFSRAVAVYYVPFAIGGRIGLYFAVLDSTTSSTLPEHDRSKGIFKPSIEFGFGLDLFLGLHFAAGPLSLDAGIGLTTIMEGGVAVWNPSSGKESDKAVYFRCRGYFSAYGKIDAKLDLKILCIEISARLALTFMITFEQYRKTDIEMKAELTVRAKIKILFITINVGFSFTFTYGFSLGENKQAPWSPGPAGNALLPPPAGEAIRPNFSPLTAAQRTPLNARYAPTLLPGAVQGAGCKAGRYVLNLFCPKAGKEGAAGLRDIFRALFVWHIASFVNPGDKGDINAEGRASVSSAQLDAAHSFFEKDGRAPGTPEPAYAQFEATIANLFALSFTAHDPNSEADALRQAADESDVAVFPVPHALSMTVEGVKDGKDGKEIVDELVTVDFSKHAPLSPEQRAEWKRRAGLYASDSGTAEDSPGEAEATEPLARIMFFDAFMASIGRLVSAARDAASAAPKQKWTIDSLWSALGDEPGSACDLFSRFLLSGQRGPVFGNGGKAAPGGRDAAIFAMLGQQFEVPEGYKTLRVTIAANGKNGGARLSTGAPFAWSLGDILQDGAPERAVEPKDIFAGCTFTPLPSVQKIKRRFLLLDRQDVGGDVFWKLPADLSALLGSSGAALAFTLKRLADVADGIPAPLSAADCAAGAQWGWAAALEFDIARFRPNGTPVYRLRGTDEQGMGLLEQALAGDTDSWDASPLALLWNRDTTGESPDLAMTANMDDFVLARIDCATETKPVEAPEARERRDASAREQAKTFCRTLLDASRVRAEGCYLWLRTGGQGEKAVGLPAGTFDDLGRARLTLVLRLTAAKDGAKTAPKYANRVWFKGGDGTTAGATYYLDPEPKKNRVRLDGRTSLAGAARELLVSVTDLAAAAEAAGLPVARSGAGSDGERRSGDSLPALASIVDEPIALDGEIEIDSMVYESKVDLPQGEAGFHITRKGAGKDGDPSSAWQLLDCRPPGEGAFAVPEEALFAPAFPSLGGGAAPENDEDWHYRFVVPYARIAASRLEGDQRGNPYAGVGAKLPLRFDWRDNYGNLAGAAYSPGDLSTWFTDDVIGMASWPGTRVGHALNAKTRMLEIRLTFAYDVPANGEDAASRLDSDYELCRKARFQIEHKDGGGRHTHDVRLVAGFAKEREKEATEDQRKRLIAYLSAAADHIDKLRSGAAHPPLPAPLLSGVTLERDVSARAELAVRVDVGVTIARTATLVHPDLLEWPCKRLAETPAPPDAATHPSTEKYEEAFRAVLGDSFRLAVGSGSSSSGEGEELWAIRKKSGAGKSESGIYVDPKRGSSPDRFSSPRPLSTKLLSRTGMKSYSYSATKGIVENPGAVLERLDADLDRWMADTLALAEEAVSPEVAVLAERLPGGLLERFREAKNSLAETGAKSLVSVLAKSSGEAASAEAAARFREEMRTDLNRYAGIPVLPEYRFAADAATSAGMAAVNLYGAPKIGSGKNRENPAPGLGVSHFKANLAPGDGVERRAAFACFSGDPGLLNVWRPDLDLQITHVEFPSGEAWPDAIRPPAWLRLVTPWSLARSAASIPVPLRQFPETPRLLERQGISSAPGGSIGDLMRWKYRFFYARRQAMQDTVTATVRIGEDQAFVPPPAGEKEDLLDVLSKAVEVLPELSGALAAASDGGDALVVGLSALCSLLEDLAAAWERWLIKGDRKSLRRLSADPEKTFTLVIGESAVGKAEYTVSIAGDSPGIRKSLSIVPIVEGWEAEEMAAAPGTWRFKRDGRYLGIEAARNAASRGVEIGGLNVLRETSVSTGIDVTRNSDLGGEAINPLFIYRTVGVDYPAPFTPVIACSDSIDLTAGKQTTLANVLGSLVSTFFDAEREDGGIAQLEISCEKALPGGVGTNVRYPVLLAGFDRDDPSRAIALADAVKAWMKEKQAVEGRLIVNASVVRKTASSGYRQVVAFPRLFAPIRNLK